MLFHSPLLGAVDDEFSGERDLTYKGKKVVKLIIFDSGNKCILLLEMIHRYSNRNLIVIDRGDNILLKPETNRMPNGFVDVSIEGQVIHATTMSGYLYTFDLDGFAQRDVQFVK
jgi:hypothetical protein